MKKTFIYALLLVLAMSCGKDEPPPPPQPDGPNATLIENMQAAIDKTERNVSGTIIVNDTNIPMILGMSDDAKVVELATKIDKINQGNPGKILNAVTGIDNGGNGRISLSKAVLKSTIGSQTVVVNGQPRGAVANVSSTNVNMNEFDLSDGLAFMDWVAQGMGGGVSSYGVNGNDRVNIDKVNIDCGEGGLYDPARQAMFNTFSPFNHIRTGKISVSETNSFSDSTRIGASSKFLYDVEPLDGSIEFDQSQNTMDIMDFGDKEARMFSTPMNQHSGKKFISNRAINIGGAMAMDEKEGTPLGVRALGNGLFDFVDESTVSYFIETMEVYGNQLKSMFPYAADTITNWQKHGKYPIKLQKPNGTNDAGFYDGTALMGYNEEFHDFFWKLINAMVNYKLQTDDQVAIQVPTYWPTEDSRNNITITPDMTPGSAWRKLFWDNGMDTISANGKVMRIILNESIPMTSRIERMTKKLLVDKMTEDQKQEALLEEL